MSPADKAPERRGPTAPPDAQACEDGPGAPATLKASKESRLPAFQHRRSRIAPSTRRQRPPGAGGPVP
eukprot:CAMPEP_0176022074 /NCGR_PEP_ID=MMETSP0120_2-20121206/10736_1 /TAXON_ID=160619 /ORGANISM="Kryptoperidinium foliaceum, Strain CCMP 1326" /LENGTH=67 /DNA_ID=CAMNT_0017355205 /DNA_START=216 /DNA_END=415 /DNA_ORIENTATION=+